MVTESIFEIVPLIEVPRAKLRMEDERPRPVVLVVDDVQVIADTRVAILTAGDTLPSPATTQNRQSRWPR